MEIFSQNTNLQASIFIINSNQTETFQSNFEMIQDANYILLNPNETCLTSYQFSFNATISLNRNTNYSIRLNSDIVNGGGTFNYETNCCPIILYNLDYDYRGNFPPTLLPPNFGSNFSIFGNPPNTEFKAYASQSTLILNTTNLTKSVNFNASFSNQILSHRYVANLNEINTIFIPYIPILNSGNQIDNRYDYFIELASPMILNPIGTNSNLVVNGGVNGGLVPENLLFKFNDSPNTNVVVDFNSNNIPITKSLSSNLHSWNEPFKCTTLPSGNKFDIISNSSQGISPTSNERFSTISFNPDEEGYYIFAIWFYTKFQNQIISRQLVTFVIQILPQRPVSFTNTCNGVDICVANNATNTQYNIINQQNVIESGTITASNPCVSISNLTPGNYTLELIAGCYHSLTPFTFQQVSQCCDDVNSSLGKFGDNCNTPSQTTNSTDVPIAIRNSMNNTTSSIRSFVLQGNLTIIGNINWRNIDLTILPGVYIFIPNGSTLNINNSFLHACDQLWGSIVVEQGGSLLINNSRIEDANLAVFARTSNQLTITQTRFRNNFEHLRVINIPNQHRIENNIFKCKSLLPFNCNNFNVIPNGITRPNTSIGNKTLSYRAISIENAFNPLNSNQEIILTNNQINDAFYGVYATKSNVRIQGLNGVSRIKDMHGFGVYFEGGKMNENMNNLTISGTLIRDIFYNSKIKWTSGMGVYLNNSTNAYILSNNFRNIDILGVNGIGNPQKGNYSLNNNTFDKFGFVGIIFSSNPQSNFNIQQNEFNNQSFSSQFPYGAIRINEDKQVFGQGSCNILQNTIKNVSYGIVCDFRQSITIKDNLIQKLPSDINSGLRLPGVLLSNVFSGTVDIFNNTVELPNGNYSSSWLDVGFEFDNTSPKAVSNIVRDLGRAFWFSGDNDFGQVSCNEFYDCEFGFTFTYSNGIDKFQGSQTSPQDNQIFYQNPTSIIHQNQDFLLDNSFFTYNPTTFYKRNGNGFTPNGSFDLIAPLNPNIILFPNSDPNETGKCGVSGGVGTGGNGNGGGKGGKIAFLRSQPNINPFGAARKWNMELSLLQSLKTDSTLSDPDLILYRDSLDQSNIGNVSRLIQGNSNTNALNLSLDPENLIQTILNLNLNDSTALDSIQYSTLMDIATQSFYKGGPAISMARTALLKHDPKLWFDYSIQTSANKTTKSEQIDIKTTKIELFPNPSTGVFNLSGLPASLNTIEIYNLQGVRIQSFETMSTTFESQKLPKGFYLIHVNTTSDNITFKLVVNE